MGIDVPECVIANEVHRAQQVVSFFDTTDHKERTRVMKCTDNFLANTRERRLRMQASQTHFAMYYKAGLVRDMRKSCSL